METKSLYERLGNAGGVNEIVSDIVNAHMENPIIRARFLPYADDPKRLAELTQLLCEFLALGSGGPEEYSGRSMAESHRGMNISAAEYMAAMDDIMGVLAKREIDQQSQNEVLAILFALKNEIVAL